MYFYKIYIEHGIYQHPYTKYKHSTVLPTSVPPFLHDILIASIYLYISQTVLGGMFGGVVDVASLIACTSTTVSV